MTKRDMGSCGKGKGYGAPGNFLPGDWGGGGGRGLRINSSLAKPALQAAKFENRVAPPSAVADNKPTLTGANISISIVVLCHGMASACKAFR